MLKDAPAGLTENAERVRLVDHQPRLMPLLDVDQLRQRRDIAIHGVEALGNNEYPLIVVPTCSQQGVEGRHVIVREALASRARQLGAQHNAVVA